MMTDESNASDRPTQSRHGFTSSSTGDPDITIPQHLETVQLPERIGHYRIKSIIASGGMGTVYLAQQESPRRVVALKVMKKGIASRSALRRFEYESQILARLRHPNIAQVFESGTHDDGTGGVPFFAMEYIPNAKPITEYARDKKLDTRQRLELFAKVCDAVQHGHQKGIIHRDLKPGNILVDPTSEGGEPRVIDFGVARATDSDMAITTMQTDIGQLIGTLQYMSPEQCEADPHNLDTRSDVYALGVVLYELLTERLPYDISHVAIHEAARVIREETPAHPSTIKRTLRGDVETITLKAMEKDRDRRYGSAGDLGKDITRFLQAQPIEARPPSLVYHFRTFAKRNKAVFVTMVTLVIAVPTLAAFAIYANLKRLEARDAQVDLVIALDQAQEAQEAAAQRADEAEWHTYLANIAAAEIALGSNSYADARRRLDACPLKLRGWEWGYLARQADPSLSVLQTHESDLNYAAFTPDGTQIVAIFGDGVVYVWDAVTGEEVAVRTGLLDDRAMLFRIRDDGMRLLTVDRNGVARLLDTATGEQLALLEILDGNSFHSFSNADSEQFITFTMAGIVTSLTSGLTRVWDADTGTEICRLKGLSQRISSAVFSPDGTRIVSISEDDTTHIWDAVTGDQIAILKGHTDDVTSASFNSDGSRIATVSKDGTARVWDAETGETISILGEHNGHVITAVFIAGGERIVTLTRDGITRQWSIESAEEISIQRPEGDIAFYPTLSADGSRVLTMSLEGSVQVWDALQGGLITRQRTGGGDRWDRWATFSQDGKRIVTTMGDGNAHIWDASRDVEAVLLIGHESFVVSAAFGPYDERIVTTSFDGTARLWDADTGNEIAVLQGHDEMVISASPSPEGTLLVTASQDDTARIWDTTNSRELHVLRGHEAEVFDAAFSSDGKKIATLSNDRTVRLWDVDTGRELTVHRGYDDIRFAAFGQDASHIVTISLDFTVQLWDVETATLIADLGQHENANRATIGPNARRIVTVNRDVAWVWNVNTGTVVASLRGHEDFITSVGFNSEGTRIVTGSNDKTVRIWNAITGDELLVLRGFDQSISSVAFSADGTLLVTASARKAYVWDSMLFRDRYVERIERSATGRKAKALCERLFSLSADWQTVVDAIRVENGMSHDVRMAALDLITVYAERQRRQSVD